MSRSTVAVIEELIGRGSFAEAASLVRELSRKRTPSRRVELAKLAELARLSYHFELSVSLLHRKVRGSGRGTAATDEEKAEYGLALAELGAGAEAFEILSALDVRKSPRIFHGLVLSYFRRWEWAASIPTIELYLGQPGLGSEEALWGEYYLARACLHGLEDLDRARALLEGLSARASEAGYASLIQESWIALADCHYLRRDWKRSVATLDRLSARLDQSPKSPISMSVRQLLAEIELFKEPRSEEALRALDRIRGEFRDLGRWEKVRACDYQQALATGDRELLTRLYFGTPHEGAKRSFAAHLREIGGELPAHYDWKLGGRGRELLDLTSGAPGLAPGRIPLRTLGALAMDLYFPAKVPSLFERLYPGERFDPASSAPRVRQSIAQTRKALRSCRSALEIFEVRGHYGLEARKGAVLRLSPPSETQAPAELNAKGLLARAAEKLGTGEFSAKQFSLSLSMTDRSARRTLKTACDQGWIVASGARRGRRYRVVG